MAFGIRFYYVPCNNLALQQHRVLWSIRFYAFGATPPLVLEKRYVSIAFCYVSITFVVSFLQFLLWDHTFGYVSFNSVAKSRGARKAHLKVSKIAGSCLRPLVGALLAIGSSTGLSITFGYVWDTFLLRLRAPFEFLKIRSHKNPTKLEGFPSSRLVYVWMAFRATVSLPGSLSKQTYTFLYVWCNPSTDS